MGTGFLLGAMEMFLELDNGDSCTALWVYSKPLHASNRVHFMVWGVHVD